MSRTSGAASSSWASDLCHPLPIACVGILSINDHLLKGSGALPGWLTGKLSDVAGLFFFPLLLAVVARGLYVALARRDIKDRRPLAALSVLATGGAFAAIKLSAAINARVAVTWGVMQMDATDLWALLVLPLSAAFMLRNATFSTEQKPLAPSPARRWLDFAAVGAAALASAATSRPPPPSPPTVPPQPVAVAASPAQVAAAAPDECARLAISVCERSANRTFVVIEATGAGPGSCEIAVSQASELAAGAAAAAERLPSRVVVKEGDTSTFSISFLRPIAPEEVTGSAVIQLEVLRAHDVRGAAPKTVELGRACVAR